MGKCRHINTKNSVYKEFETLCGMGCRTHFQRGSEPTQTKNVNVINSSEESYITKAN